MTDLTIKIPGRAEDVLSDGDFFREHPQIRDRYDAERTARRHGRGWLVEVTLPRKDWYEMAEYLASKEGALDAALRDVGDPSDRADFRAVGVVLDRLTAAEVSFWRRVRR